MTKRLGGGILAALILLSMAGAFTACSKPPATQTPPPAPKTTATPTPTPTPTSTPTPTPTPKATAPAKVIEIKMIGRMPLDTASTKYIQNFQKAVEERSGGTLKFTYYPAASLAIGMKAYEMVQAGGIQMTEITLAETAGVVPAANFDGLPTFSPLDSYIRLMYDPGSGGGVHSKLLQPGFEKQGIYLLPGIEQNNAQGNMTKKPISAMADYKGLKIRAALENLGWMVEALGATPTIISATETYTAIQRGTVDGVNSQVESMISRKWYEVASNLQQLYTTNIVLQVLANLTWWNSLSSEHQKIIKEALREQVIASYEDEPSVVAGYNAALKKGGVTIIDFKEEKNAEWVKMRDAAVKALDKNMRPKLGTTWDEFLRMYDATKDGTPAWRNILKTMQF